MSSLGDRLAAAAAAAAARSTSEPENETEQPERVGKHAGDAPAQGEEVTGLPANAGEAAAQSVVAGVGVTP
ncbi:MAG: hypothetical protein ACK4V6_21425, partial [Microthrixaceae bacterium]